MHRRVNGARGVCGIDGIDEYDLNDMEVKLYYTRVPLLFPLSRLSILSTYAHTFK